MPLALPVCRLEPSPSGEECRPPSRDPRRPPREPSCSPSCRRPCGHAVPQPVSPGSLSPLNPPKLVHRCRSYSSSGCSTGSVYVQSYGPGNLFPRRKGLEHRSSGGLALDLLERQGGDQGDRSPFERLAAVLPARHLHGRDVEEFGEAHRLEPSGLAQPAEALGTHPATASQFECDCALESIEPRAGDQQLAAWCALPRRYIASEAPAVHIAPGG